MSSVTSDEDSKKVISKPSNTNFGDSIIKASPKERTVLIGKLLYPKIKSVYPEFANHILSVMTSAFHYSELFHMLSCPYFLNIRLREAQMVIDISNDFTDPGETLQRLLCQRQPLNSLLKARLLLLLQQNSIDIADIITNKLANLENCAILHLLQCVDCLTIRIDEIRLQIGINYEKRALVVKNCLGSLEESIDISDERHLLGLDLFSTLEGDESLTDDESLKEEITPQVVMQGQGGRIFNQLCSVPLITKDHKEILIKQLVPIIKSLYTDFHEELYAFLEDLDNSELLHMLWCRGFLYTKLDDFYTSITMCRQFIESSDMEPKPFFFSSQGTESIYEWNDFQEK
ncbi:hypothetical protein Ahia01_000527400 [Argonauta hians]